MNLTIKNYNIIFKQKRKNKKIIKITAMIIFKGL